ncbi:hypothetical protein ACFQ9X_40990 [Catenulispora yoronensis]
MASNGPRHNKIQGKQTSMGDDFDSNYETFQAFVDMFPPAEAVKRLEMLGVPSETVQRIREKHELQTIRIKELEEPRTVVLGNRDTWYTGPRAGDRYWPAMVDLLRAGGWPQDPRSRAWTRLPRGSSHC